MITPPKTVLLIDDDYDIREVLVEVLQTEGYHVGIATNGKEALTYLESHPNPSLILLDLMMPVMNGFEFRARQIANPKWAEIPVVVMSADGVQQNEAKRAQLRGATFITKPPDLESFLDTVQARLGS